MVSRLTEQKGVDLLIETLPDLLKREDLRVAVVGTGERRYELFFERLARRFADKVWFYNGYSNELAHLVEAASDVFLMPSRYEPCGLNQMYSLKYGTVPIVRRTGGLADTVDLFDPDTDTGTGIVFDHYTPAALRWALDAALELYREEKTWRRMMLRGMDEDNSWPRRAEQYAELYRRLVAHGAGPGRVAAS
jgi:starch synthase